MSSKVMTQKTVRFSSGLPVYLVLRRRWRYIGGNSDRGVRLEKPAMFAGTFDDIML